MGIDHLIPSLSFVTFFSLRMESVGGKMDLLSLTVDLGDT